MLLFEDINSFIANSPIRAFSTVISITLISYLFHIIFVKIGIPTLTKIARKTPTDLDLLLIENGAVKNFSAITCCAIFLMATKSLTESPHLIEISRVGATSLLILFSLFALFNTLDALRAFATSIKFLSHIPLRIIFQLIKVGATLIASIAIISTLIGRSPNLIISGLGAMTAILMLIFKDPILGFVAGIQLSANRMLAVGDWLEMPKYGADGDVIDISLTTVKVSNWDQTITTIPTYALISDSFKNWRGMVEAGGRRIKRSIIIDSRSIRFLSESDIDELKNIALLKSYIQDKECDIKNYNSTHPECDKSMANRRALTNIGTLRAYLNHYISTHPKINQKLIHMVRLMEPTPQGIPLEIYCFTKDTGWVAYESVQGDIFDHILAITPLFQLEIYQSPSGSDIERSLSKLSP